LRRKRCRRRNMGDMRYAGMTRAGERRREVAGEKVRRYGVCRTGMSVRQMVQVTSQRRGRGDGTGGRNSATPRFTAHAFVTVAAAARVTEAKSAL